ncbi:MAG TPA: ACP S-malonyltransferase [Ideonella sp.]|uniref:ACP S-malonyltransferase n=1 Tax=Ideonella sp. TaxID=1929293 RepID=UPI002BFCD48A|nr:ACP S-malonyltransferase [Ideonella sp.]HSI48448.1 ACP S-malonyltransferase [Ideonella sp.]
MKRFAVVFPGQGSQAVGMLDAWGDHPAVQQTLDESSSVLDRDLRTLIRQGPKEQLDLTINTQLVMLVAGLACYRAWSAETGFAPVAMAGHSLGEYTALVASGSLTLADALVLVRLRSQAMQDAVPVGQGGMAAILGLDAQIVRAGCAEAMQACGEMVEAVNFNDPKQTVIAGTKLGVDTACATLKGMGAKRALLLSVSAPFHSTLMKPAAEALKVKLAEIAFAAPSVPVVNNIDVRVETSAEAIRDALYRQAFGPVRWVEVVQTLRAQGLTDVIESGPGRALTGMVKRIEPELNAVCVFDPASLALAKEALA